MFGLFPLKFNIKLYIFLFLGFVVATIVGTLSHEYGHGIVANYFGYDPTIRYGYMYWEDEKNDSFMEATYLEYCEEMEAGLDYPQKEKFESTLKKHSKDGFWITLGGPLQTMLTGTVGFFLLFFQRKKIRNANRLTLGQWLLVFLCLFWLREPANLFTWFLGFLLNGNFSLFGDEIVLTRHLDWPIWSIISIAATIGIAVLTFVVFKIVPSHQRITFLLAGFLGGVVGYLFWLEWAGPILLP